MTQIYKGKIKNKWIKNFDNGKCRLILRLEQIEESIKGKNKDFCPLVQLVAWNELAEEINKISHSELIEVETITTYKKESGTAKKVFENKEYNIYTNEINILKIINSIL